LSQNISKSPVHGSTKAKADFGLANKAPVQGSTSFKAYFGKIDMFDVHGSSTLEFSEVPSTLPSSMALLIEGSQWGFVIEPGGLDYFLRIE
jgi:hypothetical protein